VLRAAGETETTQENIHVWLQLGEGDPGFQLLTKEEIAPVIYILISISIAYIIKFPYIFVLFFCLVGLHLASVIRMTPQINPD
jgi:hypothetical protein